MARSLIEFEGIYGGSQSREVVLRVLKEALALVENTDSLSEIICSGFRIEEETPPDVNGQAGSASENGQGR